MKVVESVFFYFVRPVMSLNKGEIIKVRVDSDLSEEVAVKVLDA